MSSEMPIFALQYASWLVFAHSRDRVRASRVHPPIFSPNFDTGAVSGKRSACQSRFTRPALAARCPLPQSCADSEILAGAGEQRDEL